MSRSARATQRAGRLWSPQKATWVVLGQVQEVFDVYGEQLPLTIRQILYRLVAAYDFEKTETSDGKLCNYLDRARLARMFEFAWNHRVRPLRLTEQRQQHDRELRHRILRIARVNLDRVGEVPDTNLALGQLVDQVQGIPDRPTEPVERVHDDHVTLARVRDDLSEPGPVRRRAGLPVDVDPIARDPDPLKRVDLSIEVLRVCSASS